MILGRVDVCEGKYSSDAAIINKGKQEVEWKRVARSNNSTLYKRIKR